MTEKNWLCTVFLKDNKKISLEFDTSEIGIDDIKDKRESERWALSRLQRYIHEGAIEELFHDHDDPWDDLMYIGSWDAECKELK